jgi:predicted Zn-dependent peptidase
MGLETPDDVASRLGSYIAISGGLDAARRLFAAYADIGADDVRDAAERYFDERRRTVGVLRAKQ